MEQSAFQSNTATDQIKRRELLYHYTDQRGLIGILGDKKIWATNIRYLNDTQEGRIIFSLLFDELSSRSNAGPLFEALGINKDEDSPHDEVVDEAILSRGLAVSTWVTSQSVFVTSFSARGDSLSQWRAYSGRSGGYSLGFEKDYLVAVGTNFLRDRQDLFYSDAQPLSRCIYAEDAVGNSLRDEIKQLVTAYIQKGNSIKNAQKEVAGMDLNH